MSSESEAKLKSNDENPPLKTLGKYTIDRLLGQGGMGAVYLAHRTDLKKTVALKVLPKEKARNPTLVKRFQSRSAGRRTARTPKHRRGLRYRGSGWLPVHRNGVCRRHRPVRAFEETTGDSCHSFH